MKISFYWTSYVKSCQQKQKQNILFIGFYAQYQGDESHTPNLSIVQYSYITNLHMYPCI